jgi:NADP-dependent 3-hydroxy acid dehydrogenase YdfG
MRVAVTGRTAGQVPAVTQEIGGTALVGNVSSRKDVERWVREAGALDLLVANAGIVEYEPEAWRMDPSD